MATAITKEVCAILSSNVYDSDDCVPITEESDWQVLIKASDLAQTTENYDIISPSFGATAYYNSKTNELIIAYRGSENDLDDWINNNFGGWGCDEIPPQFYDANNFYDILKEKIDNGDFETQIGKNSL